MGDCLAAVLQKCLPKKCYVWILVLKAVFWGRD